MYQNLILALIFIFGAIIGSFLNVVILRYRSGRHVGGRSSCYTCNRQLGFSELVPIGSFLAQGGKCVGCKSKISWQYPVIEAVTGFAFMFLFIRFSYLVFAFPWLFMALFAFHAVAFCFLIVLSAYDFRHHVLPDKLVFLFASIAFVGMFLFSGDMMLFHIPEVSRFLAGIILPIPFTLLWYVSKGKWMGLGDAKLMIGIGFLLGISAGITAIFIAFWIGAIVGVVLIGIAPLLKKGKITLKTAIPFGPFLALGTAIVLIAELDLASLVQLLSSL
jgi:prepilin signal peptidase PulO-like enzyme (type II secretory pathway)